MRENSWFRHPALAAGLSMTLAATLAGCGEGEVDGRVEVSGVVTLDGQQLDEGHITLRPLGSGPSVSGPVKGGEFHLPPSEGPAAGPYVVEIDAVRPTGRMIESPDLYNGELVEETSNIIPLQYNRQSTLRVEVVAEGENRFDFPVTSR